VIPSTARFAVGERTRSGKICKDAEANLTLLARQNCFEFLGISTKMPYVLFIELRPKRLGALPADRPEFARPRRNARFLSSGLFRKWHVDP
jgi:hypothetical protein